MISRTIQINSIDRYLFNNQDPLSKQGITHITLVSHEISPAILTSIPSYAAVIRDLKRPYKF